MIQALINITVIEGENSSLTCHVSLLWSRPYQYSGTPMPSVSWTEARTGDRPGASVVKSHCQRKPGGGKRLGSADFLYFFSF